MRCSARRSRVAGVRPGKAARALVAVLLLVVSAGCGSDERTFGPGPIAPVGPIDIDDDGLAGSGELIAELRQVGEFDRMVLSGEGAITISFGGEPELSVETDDNLLELIETTLSDGVLDIRTAGGRDIAPTDSVRYRITTTELASVEIAGAGSIDIEEWTAARVTVSLTGAGEIRIGALDAETLLVNHDGVGSISVAGTASSQTVTMSGVGEYEAADLESVSATVDVGGVASATLWVTGTLEMTAQDTGSIAYYGFPEVTQRVDDLGAVTTLGER